MGGRGRGFSLVEAVLAVALAGLFALGAQATVQKLGPGLHLRSGLWQVTSGLSQARFEAILSGTAVRVRFAPAGFSLERYDESAGSWRPARTVVLDGVRVRANNAPIFHPQGTVSGMASITVENARGSYRITVAITGRIRTVRTG